MREPDSPGILIGWRRASTWPKWVRTASPLELALALVGIAIAGYVLAYPFSVVTYPPLVDLPFHAAETSILRHYWDPSFHFKEQFQLEFLKVPYWTQYVLGAGLATLLPIRVAVKVTAVVCLAALPAGLGILCRGMKKSPYLGIFALPLVWNKLTHWGFLNYVAALGLSAAALGFTFLVLDAPSRARRIGLASSLTLVFATHVFRYPFTLAAMFGSALLLYPVTRRWKELLLPVLPSLSLFAVWWLGREPLAASENVIGSPHFERIHEASSLVFDSFRGPEEDLLALRALALCGVVAVASLALARFAPRTVSTNRNDERFRFATHAAVFSIAAVYLWMFLTLPMSIGVWWYVYPREIVAALFMALALLPDLPRGAGKQLALVAVAGFGSVMQAAFVSERYREFEDSSADFRDILAYLPKAPRLGYMMFDLSGTSQIASPYLHLPAWVQAEKGGWLSFHFVSWRQSPIRYREGSQDVPPETPLRFEWTPNRFDLRTRGRFFDWFLVRSQSSPDARFAVDQDLRRVAHRGRFWLYRRDDVTSRRELNWR
ncbi:MAG TPA: hypothetical protein VG937_19945 [Polyangiaceae bacterium]|nr:hypothetical protein [Polyangiaceae bacterium]